MPSSRRRGPTPDRAGPTNLTDISHSDAGTAAPMLGERAGSGVVSNYKDDARKALSDAFVDHHR
jgi:hypothetical protein